MHARSRIVVIGASAGGVDALRRLLGRLPPDFSAPVLVVLHVGNHYSALPKILQKDVRLRLQHASGNEPVEPGVVLLAPPDRHLLLEDGMTRLTHGPKENFSRPAIDPLFRTAALFYRERAIGIILTGLLDDGTVGLQAIKAYGGIAMVQDPAEADEAAMPRSALQHVDVDFCLPLEALGDKLMELAASTPEDPALLLPSRKSIEAEGRFDLGQKTVPKELAEIAIPSGFACPECQGVLWEIRDTAPAHFRCHTGHVYTEQGLAHAQDGTVEEALWAAIRALHEKQMMLERLANSAAKAQQHDVSNEHAATAEAAARHAETLRKMIVAQGER